MQQHIDNHLKLNDVNPVNVMWITSSNNFSELHEGCFSRNMPLYIPEYT